MAQRPLYPIGEDAFRLGGTKAAQSRTAQLQCLAIQALGIPEQIASIAADADAIGTPRIEVRQGIRGSIDTRLLESDALDAYTQTALAADGASQWQPGAPASAADLVRMRRKIEEGGEPAEVLSLLNLSLTGPSHLERVAAAQALEALSRGRNRRAREVLTDAEATPPGQASAIATTAGQRLPRSLALHGTWARLSRERWYAPGHPLHSHIAAEASTNLWQGEDYPRWSGGYTPEARRAGAASLLRWVGDRDDVIAGIDTIYTHSHGGNVALTAAASGLEIELLVLLHVPPLSRPDSEWEAIRLNVKRVLVYRTLLDHVVLADMIRTAVAEDERPMLSQRFDAEKLPHVDNEPHPIFGPWFSHEHFLRVSTWVGNDIAGDVRYFRSEPPMST